MTFTDIYVKTSFRKTHIIEIENKVGKHTLATKIYINVLKNVIKH